MSEQKKTVNVGVVGLGRRAGSILFQCLQYMPDVRITHLCDFHEPTLHAASQRLADEGYPVTPVCSTDYRTMLADASVDAVFILTGWEDHAKIATDAVLANKYTAVEVGCAFTLAECQRLIDAYHTTHAPLMMLENCCYDRPEMMALNIVKQGLFGDIVHCDGAYMHNLPACELFLDIDKEPLHYRINSYLHRNCEQYPTHALGPICKVLDINRGNRMMTLSSFASRTGGLREAAAHILGEDSPYAKADYKQGDIITTVITCAGGETIRLTLDTTLPRPFYSRDFTVRGTKGMYTENGHAVFFEGMAEPVRENLTEMYQQYDHPLYRQYATKKMRGGHGGIDWLVTRAFLDAVKRGVNTPIDAYDTVAWMAIAPLSEMSIARGGAPVDVPDFTEGRWCRREAYPTGAYCLNEVCEVPDIDFAFPEEDV